MIRLIILITLITKDVEKTNKSRRWYTSEQSNNQFIQSGNFWRLQKAVSYVSIIYKGKYYMSHSRKNNLIINTVQTSVIKIKLKEASQ